MKIGIGGGRGRGCSLRGCFPGRHPLVAEGVLGRLGFLALAAAGNSSADGGRSEETERCETGFMGLQCLSALAFGHAGRAATGSQLPASQPVAV